MVRKLLQGSVLLLVLLGAVRCESSPSIESLLKILPQFDGWKRDAPFSQEENGGVVAGAEYARDGLSLQFMIMAGPESSASGPIPEDLEEERSSGRAESDISVFTFLKVDGFDAVIVEMKDESGASVWVDLRGKGWIILGGDGEKPDALLGLLAGVQVRQFALQVQ